MVQNLAEQIEKAMSEKAPTDQSEPTQGDADILEELDTAPEGGPSERETDEPEAVEGESPQEDVPESYTPQKLAEAIGWEAADLYNLLQIPYDDGESLTLGQLKDSRSKILEERQAIEQAKAQLQAEQARIQQQLAATSQPVSPEMQQAQEAMADVRARYNAIPWEQWEEQDAGKAANARQKLAMEWSQAKGQYEQAAQAFQGQQQQVMSQMVYEHDRKLVSLVPQWSDMATYQKEQPEVARFMVERMGFAPEELQTVYHGPARATAYYAWKYFQTREAQEQAKQKMRSAPKKVLRPGQGKQPERVDAQVNELVKQARKTHTRRDKTAAAKAVLARGLSRRGSK